MAIHYKVNLAVSGSWRGLDAVAPPHPPVRPYFCLMSCHCVLWVCLVCCVGDYSRIPGDKPEGLQSSSLASLGLGGGTLLVLCRAGKRGPAGVLWE